MNRAILALVFSASVAMAEPGLFPFVFHETTGITQHIVRDGHEVAIRFSERSDKTALATLDSLDWRIIYASADGKHIFLRGELSPKVKRDPKNPKLKTAEPEDYQEFTLLDWHIRTPFPTYELIDSKNPLGGWKTIMRSSLKQAGFDKLALDGASVSYTRFEQSKRQASKPK